MTERHTITAEPTPDGDICFYCDTCGRTLLFSEDGLHVAVPGDRAAVHSGAVGVTGWDLDLGVEPVV